MIPVGQLLFGDGKDGRPMGDCFRACVASIFEMPAEAVPHFMETPSTFYSDFHRWLRPRGMSVLYERWEPSGKPVVFQSGWWIALVKSENIDGDAHAVVMHGLETPRDDSARLSIPAHDPSPYPRRTPYIYLGAYRLQPIDPAQIARAMYRPAEAP